MTLAFSLGSRAATDFLPAADGSVPGYPGVIGELVRIAGADTAAPDALDSAHFLRLRAADVADGVADAVVIAQPGFSSTPGMWLQTSAQLVSKARERDCPTETAPERRCHLEVWVVDRRGSQVEDTLGLRRAWLEKDPKVGVDYYFGRSVYNEKGTMPPPADGNYDSLLGKPDAAFRPLTQNDLAFEWDWGFEAAAGDVDALIARLEAAAPGKNVFIAGHSQGGGFVSAWAGRRAGDGRGHERIAGLVFLDGGPSIGNQEQPSEGTLTAHLKAVEALRSGAAPRYGARLGMIQLGSGLAVRSAVQGLFYVLEPEAEAILAPAVQPHPAALCFVMGYHLPKEACGGVGLRVTNYAHAGMAFDDDPIPGAFLQTPMITALGIRSGHLDFVPRQGTEGSCAAAGPEGEQPPCPPTVGQVDPARVYSWLDGGGRGAAGEDGPLNGWTFMNGTFSERLRNAGANPSRAVAYVQQTGYAPRRTNVQPITVELADSGKITIDARVLNGMTWYQSARYDLDSRFVGGHQKLTVERDGVTHDIDKTGIAVPVYVAARSARPNPFPGVSDYTAIGPEGTEQSDVARELSPIDAAVSSVLYGHTDFLAADDSLAGQVRPGQPGANLVSATLVDWILARATGLVRPPTPEELGVVDWSKE